MVGKTLGFGSQNPYFLRRRPESQRLLQYLLLFAAMALTIVAPALDSSDSDVLRRYVISLTALLGCLYLPDWENHVSSGLRTLMLGMYILHVPLIQQIIYRLEAVVPLTIPLGVEVALVAVLSLAAVWILRLTPLRRFT